MKTFARLALSLMLIGVGQVIPAGADQEKSVYVALATPCRLGDTRNTGMPVVAPGGSVEWLAYGADLSAQGGAGSPGCPTRKQQRV